ncbi:hypothetical protein B0T13DRAFT_469195, partial [Neurospora crassa]
MALLGYHLLASFFSGWQGTLNLGSRNSQFVVNPSHVSCRAHRNRANKLHPSRCSTKTDNKTDDNLRKVQFIPTYQTTLCARRCPIGLPSKKNPWLAVNLALSFPMYV